MYASSGHLKTGLHRVLAVAHALTATTAPGVNVAWWSTLAEVDREPARQHALGLEALAREYADRGARTMLDEARARLDLPAVDHAAVQAAFRAAIINGRAHSAHGGRDVYGSSNKGLWDLVCADFGRATARQFGGALGDDPVVSADAGPSLATLDALRTLIAFDTSPDGQDHDACVGWLGQALSALGFSLRVLGADLGRPVIVAHRASRGLAGHVVLYGHYDTTPVGPVQRWKHAPTDLTLADGRLHARGVADNKGPLAGRLVALADLDASPALTWLIQGEEETGSPVAHAIFPEVMRGLAPTVWLDETGYHDHADGTLRLLARTLGADDASDPPDADLDDLLRGLRGLASRWSVASRIEHRGLNKSLVEGGCPFNRSLPLGARYLAIGVNDSVAHIHGLNESLPAWTFPLHAAELDVVFRWAGRVAAGQE